MTLIPASEWTSCVDPTDPSTLNDNGQFTAAGELWQRRETGVGWMSRRYGLRVEEGFALDLTDGEVRSLRYDGSSLRAGFIDDPDLALGQAFITRQVWTSHPDYRASAQQSNGINLSVPWPEGGDRLRFDGTRTSKDVIPTGPDDPVAIRASRDGTGDRVLLCHAVRVKPWMMGRHLAAMCGAVHAHFSPRSPFTVMIGEGALQIVTRTTTDLIVDQQPPEKLAGSIKLTPADIGGWMLVCHDVRVDPVSGHLTSMVRTPSGGWIMVVLQGGGLGYTRRAGDPRNDMFFAKLASTYGWHNDNGPNRAPQNWDPDYGTLRESRYGWSGVMVGRPDVALGDVMSHAESIVATTPPPPDPDPGLAELVRRVTQLEDRLGQVEDKVEGHGNRLDQVARAWTE